VGVFTLKQAEAAGLSRKQVRVRRERGIWQRVAGRGWMAAGQEPTLLQRCMAASLTWPDGVIVGPSAVALWGIAGYQDLARVPINRAAPITLEVPHDRARQVGLEFRERATAPEDLRHYLGITVIDPFLAIADALAIMPEPDGERSVAWLVSRQGIRADDLDEGRRRYRRRPGKGKLDRYARLVGAGAASEAELRLHALLQDAGIEGWEPNCPIRVNGRIIASGDVVFEEAKLIVEVDGFSAHGGRDAFARDRGRLRELQMAGYRVLPFTWHEIVDRPAEVVAEIRAALARNTSG
jgi:very-short-patch-repair endonuclease